MSMIETLARKALMQLPAEDAHGIGIKALKLGLVGGVKAQARGSKLQVSKAGLIFENPLGMAAGFDKNAEIPNQLIHLGFGFSEVGTITPLAQAGNPKPRIFRLKEHNAVINRLGFNNKGADNALSNLQTIKNSNGLIGINIGANKLSEDRIADYVAGINSFYHLAGYFTVNISSPNTPGLRDLQSGGELKQLLSSVDEARAQMSDKHGHQVPTLLKIAPDMGLDQLAQIVTLVKESHFEGMVVSNTTLSRDAVSGHINADQAGGLSGQPLFEASTSLLAHTRKLLGPEPLLFGVGGVCCGEDVVAKMQAGADVVQVYSGFVYKGTQLICDAMKCLSTHCYEQGFDNVSQITSSEIDYWADQFTDQ